MVASFGQELKESLQQLETPKGIIPDYASLVNLRNVYQPPVSGEDQAFAPETPYGAPEGWDYKTSQTGMNNEPLPDGAVGWTPQGKPWYGNNNAIAEWYDGLSNRLWRDAEGKPDTTYLEQSRQNSDKFYENVKAGNYKEALSEYFSGILQGVGLAAQTLGDVGLTEGEGPGALALTTRGVGEVLGGIGSILEEVDKGVEKYVFGTIEGIEDVADTSDLPELVREEQMERLPDNFGGNAVRFAANLGEAINPITLGWNVIRAIQAPGTVEEKGEIISQSVAAGRAAYSSWIDPAMKIELVNRIEAGENPYLLAEELARPGAEIVGGLIFDPMNIVGVMAKSAAATKRLTTFENLIQPVSDVAPHLDEITDLVRTGEKITDAPAGLIDGVMTGFRKIGTKYDTLASNIGISSYTSTAQRHLAQRIVGDHFSWMARSLDNNPDRVMEAVKATMMLSSESADDVARGIAILGEMSQKYGLPMGPLFSETGARMSIMLRDVLSTGGKLDVIKFADELTAAKTPEKLLEIFDPKIEKAAKRAFPTLAQRAANGEDLGTVGRGLLRAEEVANGKALRGVNSFYAHVYMGMSPGYVIRNAITNKLHIFVDQGFGAFVQKGKFLHLRGEEEFLTNIYGALPKAAKAGIGASGLEASNSALSKLFGKGLRAAQAEEQNASIRVFASYTRDTFRKMLVPGKAIPDVKPLLDSGMDLASANTLQSLLIRANGNVDEAAALFRTAAADGSIDVLKTFDWIKDADDMELDKLKLLEPVKEIIYDDNLSKEDVIRAIDDLFDDAHSVGDEVANEIISYPKEIHNSADAPHHLDAAVSFAENTMMGNATKAVSAHQKTANLAADYAFRDIGLSLFERAKGLGLDGEQFLKENPLLSPFIDGSFFEKVNESYKGIATGLSDTTGKLKSGAITTDEAWRAAGLAGKAPPLPPQQMANYLWDGLFRPNTREAYRAIRESNAQGTSEIIKQLLSYDIWDDLDMGWLDESLSSANALLKKARDWDSGVVVGSSSYKVSEAVVSNTDHIAKMAILNGIATNSGEFGTVSKPFYNHILAAVNKYGDKKYKNIYEVPAEAAEAALKARAADKGIDFVAETGEILAHDGAKLQRLASPEPMEVIPSTARPYHNARNRLDDIRNNILTAVESNWGQKKRVFTDDNISGALDDWVLEAKRRTNEMRLVAQEVATAGRNFALGDYPARRNFETALGIIMPYARFYTFTYPNWAKRLAENPQIITAYARYRRELERIHANAPEWWRYNVNSDELLGLFPENPMFVNLEATLNPLNGIMGVDFNDPYRKTGWFTTMVDYLGHHGPSTHPLLQLAIAFGQMVKGEEEAAARWGGRLLPITQTLGSAQAVLQSGFDLGPVVEGGPEVKWDGFAQKDQYGGTGNYNVQGLDPWIQIFSGGVDPYTERRVNGRALPAMVSEGLITPEQAIDTARDKEGEIWDAAFERAMTERAPGQLSSFLFGQGFKIRNQTDLQIDQMYNEYFGLLENRGNMSPDKFRMAFDSLHRKYDFMDTVLIGIKGGLERDTAYTYSILSRLPPGGSTEIFDMVDLDRRLVSKFYDTKGDLTQFTESERGRLMSAVSDMGAILAIPEDAARQEWTQASNAYKDLRNTMSAQFGEDIHEKIDAMYGLWKMGDKSEIDTFQNKYPEVERALDFKAAVIANNPYGLLATYYGGLEQIEGYWKGYMYNRAEVEFGKNIFNLNDQFWSLPQSERSAFKRRNPQLEKYWKFRNEMGTQINQQIVQFASMLQEPKPVGVREKLDNLSFSSQDLLAGIQAPDQTPTFQEWREEIGDDAINVIYNNVVVGQPLTSRQKSFLSAVADDLDMSRDRLIQLVGISFYVSNFANQ